MVHPQVRYLLADPWERPLRGIARRSALGGLYAVSVWGIQSIYGLVHWHTLPAFVVIGLSMSFFAWGAERLWFWSVSGFFGRPFGAPAYVTRIPFWYAAGGAAYVLGMLLAKKASFIGFYDQPVEPLFFIGGVVGCLVQVPLQVLVLLRVSGQPAGEEGGSR